MNEPVAGFSARAGFLMELARHLHAYGTTAQRLEGALSAVARRLRVDCEVWSNPTGIILSFSDPARGAMTEVTRVIRLEPGETDLRKLAAADAIAEDVLAGRLAPEAGSAALKALQRPPGRRGQILTAISFGLAAASVAGILRASWLDIAAAATIGGIIGVFYVLAGRRPRLSEALEAVAALVATLLVAAAATMVPLSLQTVVVASLIVLMPGLMLTNAMSELTSRHLVSGTARFAGAMTTLLKLTFGTVAAAQLARLLGWTPLQAPATPSPDWIEWPALAIGAYAFAVLFRADRRDYLLVMASVALGYVTTRVAGALLDVRGSGFALGAFVGGIVVTAASNVYARWRNRPGALVRVPGIILLVPGSVGFRTLSFVFERNFSLGADMAFVLANALVALVAGLLFGNLLIPARRNL